MHACSTIFGNTAGAMQCSGIAVCFLYSKHISNNREKHVFAAVSFVTSCGVSTKDSLTLNKKLPKISVSGTFLCIENTL